MRGQPPGGVGRGKSLLCCFISGEYSRQDTARAGDQGGGLAFNMLLVRLDWNYEQTVDTVIGFVHGRY